MKAKQIMGTTESSMKSWPIKLTIDVLLVSYLYGSSYTSARSQRSSHIHMTLIASYAQSATCAWIAIQIMITPPAWPIIILPWYYQVGSGGRNRDRCFMKNYMSDTGWENASKLIWSILREWVARAALKPDGSAENDRNSGLNDIHTGTESTP